MSRKKWIAVPVCALVVACGSTDSDTEPRDGVNIPKAAEVDSSAPLPESDSLGIPISTSSLVMMSDLVARAHVSQHGSETTITQPGLEALPNNGAQQITPIVISLDDVMYDKLDEVSSGELLAAPAWHSEEDHIGASADTMGVNTQGIVFASYTDLYSGDAPEWYSLTQNVADGISPSARVGVVYVWVPILDGMVTHPATGQHVEVSALTQEVAEEVANWELISSE